MSLMAIWKRIETGLVLAGRARARREMLVMSDRLLAESGFSRELLEQGVEAWPWRLDVVDEAPAPIEEPEPRYGDSEEVIARAVAELSAYTDSELDELGISRTDIARVVRYGEVAADEEPLRAA